MDAETDCRFLGMSASLANAKDVADWMGVKSANMFNFSPKVRPIPLDTYIQSFEVNNFSSRLLAMGKPLYNGIRRHSTGRPALVFVPSRRQAQLTAIDLMTYASNGIDEDFDGFLQSGSENALESILGSVKEAALGQVLGAGIGFLHKGMNASDRKRVEGLFRDGVISGHPAPRQCQAIKQAAVQISVLRDFLFFYFFPGILPVVFIRTALYQRH